MKICEKCRSTLPDDKNFCGKCGASLLPEAASAPAAAARRESYEIKLRSDPRNAKLHEEFGDFLASVGLKSQAERELRTSLDLEPSSAAPRQKLAQMLAAEDRADEAATQLLLLLEQRPDDVATHEALADAYVRGGREADALDVLSKLDVLVPLRLELLLLQRRILGRMGRAAELELTCERIVRLDPGSDAWLTLGRIHEQNGRHEAAVTAYRMALQAGHSTGRAHLLVGLSADGEAAAHHLLKALELGEIAPGERAVATLQLSRHELRRGALEAAQKHMDWVVRHFTDLPKEWLPTYGSCLVALGDRELEAGRTDLARSWYERAAPLVGNLPALRRLDEEREGARRRQRRLLVIATAAVALVSAAASGGWYFCRGAVRVRVSPAPARISIRLAGDTPLYTVTGAELVTSLHPIWAPLHLSVARDGYAGIDRTIRSEIGRGTASVDFELTPQLGSVKAAAASVDKARLTVREERGERSCETPCTLTGVLATKVEVKVSADGFESFESARVVKPDEVIDLGTIAFEGGFRLDSIPRGAEVVHDGRVIGTTPYRTVSPMPAKPTEVILRKSGYQEASVSLVLKPLVEIDAGTAVLRAEVEASGQVVTVGNLACKVDPGVMPQGVCGNAEPYCRQLSLGPWSWRLPSEQDLRACHYVIHHRPGCAALNRMGGCATLCTQGGASVEGTLAYCVADNPPKEARAPTKTMASTSAGTTMYRARLSARDHANSDGMALRTAAGVIQQDRANFHKFGLRDTEDTSDEGHFATKEERAWLERAVRNAVDARMANSIVNGSPLVEVVLHPGRRIEVRIVSE